MGFKLGFLGSVMERREELGLRALVGIKKIIFGFDTQL